MTISMAACFAIYYFEAFDVGYRSAASYIIAPEVIRKTPLIDVCEDPKFSWKGRDGESPQYISLAYGTLQPPTDLIESYKVFFEKKLSSESYSCLVRGGADDV